MFIIFRSITEDKPGKKWQERFENNWPFYKHWFLSEGSEERPGYLTSKKMLGRYMPELIPIYDQICDLSGGGDLESRYLSHWCPPPYMSGCSQVAWVKEGPALIRNYDYGIEYFEGVLLKSNWLKPVMGMAESSWGLLDGINEDGLIASLTFGGRRITGDGIGIPLIIRYVLETCKNVHEAIEVLVRIPVHMSYNVTLLDSSSEFYTVYMSPDKSADVTNWAVGTNHQHQIEWPDYAKMTKTVERKEYLDNCWMDPHETRHSMVSRFLHEPLFNRNYNKRFGTLYTAEYDALEKSIKLHWHHMHLKQTFDHFEERKDVIQITESVGHKLAY